MIRWFALGLVAALLTTTVGCRSAPVERYSDFGAGLNVVAVRGADADTLIAAIEDEGGLVTRVQELSGGPRVIGVFDVDDPAELQPVVERLKDRGYAARVPNVGFLQGD